ncbi:MAG TPA: hypothetical protein VEX61_07780 [Burkholderiales bacterium]|nr:hypothetical protein [Burkholderiales bacterium]
MSAAATAAGYLYASGRLRGRGAREQEPHEAQPRAEEKKPREEVRVAVLPAPEDRMNAENPAQKPRRTPKIEYRTRRRWSAA